MSKQKIQLVVGLMSLALVGLIAFQYIYVRDAVKAGEARFKHQVYEAMHHVTMQLEQQEVLLHTYETLAQSMVSIRLKSGEVLVMEDADKVDQLNIDPNQIATIDIHRKPLQQEMSFVFQMQETSENGTQKVETQHWVMGGNNGHGEPDVFVVTQENMAKVKHRIDSTNKATNRFISEETEVMEVQPGTTTRRIMRKKAMYNVAVNAIVDGPQPLEKRVNQPQLDSLLRVELADRGITTEIAYGVWNAQQDSMLYMNQPEKEKSLRKSELKASLFPNDILKTPNFLTVYFPHKTSFLLRQVATTLGASIVLVLVIVFCFAYAIHTIVRQKKVSEIKNDFINNMTHEFKTPIATVSLACEALQDPTIQKQHEFVNRYLGVIRDENNRLGKQVEKVLQIATLDRKDFKLKLEAVNVHEVIERALNNIDIQIAQRGGIIEKTLNAEKAQVTADPVHLSNIVYNLLDNANKYSPEEPKISITTLNTVKGIIIQISDRGIGMTKEAIRKIFDKFYRVPTGNLHDVKGFGLGLAYVKTMVEAHQGNIQVTSELNKGSTFEIFLPYSHG